MMTKDIEIWNILSGKRNGTVRKTVLHYMPSDISEWILVPPLNN